MSHFWQNLFHPGRMRREDIVTPTRTLGCRTLSWLSWREEFGLSRHSRGVPCPNNL